MEPGQNKVKPFKLPNREAWVKAKLRNASIYWPAKEEAIRRARIERGIYQCAMCHKGFPRKDIQADHINTVVDIKKGWISWDDYIERLLCPPEGYRALCRNDHATLTAIQNEMRKHFRQEKKRLSKATKKRKR